MRVRPYQRIANELIHDIRNRIIPEGSKLPAERKLSERFGVSRPLIREAIIALEIMGYVEVWQNSGAYVIHAGAAPSTDLDVGAFELFEARVLIEGEVAFLAAKLMTDERVEELENELSCMDQGYNSNDLRAIEAADRRFHELIAQATDNSVLIATVKELWSARSRSPLAVRIVGALRQSGQVRRVDEHREIFNALRDRKAAAARHAMRRHIGQVLEEMFEATRIEAVAEAMAKAGAEVERRATLERNRYTLTLGEAEHG